MVLLASPMLAADVQVEKGLPYHEVDGVTLEGDLYRIASDETRPGVVLIHGGGWTKGNRGQMRSIARQLAKDGFVAFSVSYRLAPEHPYPAAFDDALTAYRWLLAQPSVDSGRIVVAGDSAGAGLAVTLAADARDAGLPLPSCIIGNSPYADLALESPSLNDPARNLPRALVGRLAPREGVPVLGSLAGLAAGSSTIRVRRCRGSRMPCPSRGNRMKRDSTPRCLSPAKKFIDCSIVSSMPGL